jgi:hypothetical protein
MPTVLMGPGGPAGNAYFCSPIPVSLRQQLDAVIADFMPSVASKNVRKASLFKKWKCLENLAILKHQ